MLKLTIFILKLGLTHNEDTKTFKHHCVTQATVENIVPGFLRQFGGLVSTDVNPMTLCNVCIPAVNASLSHKKVAVKTLCPFKQWH